MGQLRNLVGLRFGNLLVIEQSESVRTKGGNKITRWKCRCDCGVVKIIRGANIVNAGTRSCGCIRMEKLIKHSASFNKTISNYRCKARRRGLEFKLSRERFRELILGNCYYCGAPPSNTYKTEHRPNTVREWKNEIFLYNGVDRLDSDEGYTDENSVTCCATCNWMKRDYSLEYFYNHIKQITEFSKEKIWKHQTESEKLLPKPLTQTAA